MKHFLSAFSVVCLCATIGQAGDLAIYAKNVDDRVDIYYNGAHQASCTWAKNPGCNTGVNGSASGTIEVRFKLTNFVYKGVCLLGKGKCGKAAGDFYIEHNGAVIWSEGFAARDNTEGVKFDRTLTCNLSTNTCK